MKKKIIRIAAGILLVITLFSNSIYAKDKDADTIDYFIKFSKLSTGRKYTLDSLMEKYKENMRKAQKSEIAIKLDKVNIKKIERIDENTQKTVNRLADDKNEVELRNNNYILAQDVATRQLQELNHQLNSYVGDKNTPDYIALKAEFKETEDRLIYLSRLIAQMEESVKILNNQMVDLINEKNKQKPDMLFEKELAAFSSQYSDDIMENVTESELVKMKSNILKIIPLILEKESIEDNLELLTVIHQRQKKALALGFVSEEIVHEMEESQKKLNNDLNTINSTIEEKKNTIRIQAGIKNNSSLELFVDLNDIKPLYSINYYLKSFEENSIHYRKLNYTRTAYENLIKNYNKHGKRFVEQAEVAHYEIQKIDLEKKEFMNSIEVSIQGIVDSIKKIKGQLEGVTVSIGYKEKELNQVKLKETLGIANSMEILKKENEVKALKTNFKMLQFQLYMYHKALESFQKGIYQ